MFNESCVVKMTQFPKVLCLSLNEYDRDLYWTYQTYKMRITYTTFHGYKKLFKIKLDVSTFRMSKLVKIGSY